MAWLDDYERVSRWASKYDVRGLLSEHGGLVRLENFLPPHVAEAALHVLEAIPQAKWNDTSATKDYTHNNIQHAFLSVKAHGSRLGALLRAFTLLLPGELSTFSAARYERTHGIAPHDDRAYTDVRLNTGAHAKQGAGRVPGGWGRKRQRGTKQRAQQNG
jgi:hypothetical protein